MTANEVRASVLVRALRAGMAGDTTAIGQLYTADVKGWSPWRATTSLTELAAEIEAREDSFSDMEAEVTPLDVGGDYACAEWSVAMTHSGELALPDGATLEPTGLRVRIYGVTVAEFDGERICAFRQYWDEFTVLEQLGILARDPG